MNISPCNPINKIANSDILNNIFDSFAEIEQYNLRVDKITLEKDRYDELITRRGSLDYLSQNENLDIRGITEEGALIGALFGVTLEIGKESKVYSENWCMDYEIKFDTPSLNAFKRKLNQLKSNLTIIVRSRAIPIHGISQSERVAIETLREMITETEFRKYIIHGFILVKGRSGRIYQIFRSNPHTRVWEKGVLIEEVCVRIRDAKIPPTDNLIAFKILIETDENEFRKIGNVYNMAEAA